MYYLFLYQWCVGLFSVRRSVAIFVYLLVFISLLQKHFYHTTVFFNIQNLCQIPSFSSLRGPHVSWTSGRSMMWPPELTTGRCRNGQRTGKYPSCLAHATEILCRAVEAPFPCDKHQAVIREWQKLRQLCSASFWQGHVTSATDWLSVTLCAWWRDSWRFRSDKMLTPDPNYVAHSYLPETLKVLRNAGWNPVFQWFYSPWFSCELLAEWNMFSGSFCEPVSDLAICFDSAWCKHSYSFHP